MQSYSPDRDAINYAVKGLTEEFYKNELEARQILNFPPYSRLLRLVFRSQKPDAAQNAAQSAYNILYKCRPQGVDILGPAECPLEMVNGSHRHQILLRSKQIRPLQEMAKKLVWGFKPPKDVYIETDTDPVSLL